MLFLINAVQILKLSLKRIEYLGSNKLLEIFIYLILFFDLSTWTKFEKQIFLLVFFNTDNCLSIFFLCKKSSWLNHDTYSPLEFFIPFIQCTTYTSVRIRIELINFILFLF